MQGRIIKLLAGFYFVQAEGIVVRCRGRGRLKNDNVHPVVGDRV
ncbi:MAG: ribosome small subunit-dependent GTPase A, partial [bacterium]|nr:ribosome small subunit-dependent GTPase A [bacterium]